MSAKRPEVLSGTFSGMVVTLFMPKDLVRTWLPAGLQLAKDCPYAEQPVVILFGSIDDLTREKVVTVKPRFGRHYLETFIAVPYLQFERTPQAKPVFHFVRVYSDSKRGTVQGIRKYGWPKILTPIDTTEGTYRISREGFGSVLAAEMEYARLKPIEAANRFWKQVQEMLSQPMVLKHEGAFHLYSFDFHFASSSNNSIPVRLELREGFMPHIKPMKGLVPGIADSDFGAFYIECRYTKTPLDAGE